jgi:hypothetical protein
MSNEQNEFSEKVGGYQGVYLIKIIRFLVVMTKIYSGQGLRLGIKPGLN